MPKYAYSHDEELYHGDYDTPEEAAIEGLDGADENDRVWVGVKVPPPQPELYFQIEDLIENVSCQDEYGLECAEDWYDGTAVQEKEINAEVSAVIGRWLDKHGLRPKFFLVEETIEWELDGDQPVPAGSK